VAHALALGGGAAGDERRLRDVAQVLGGPGGRLFLRGAPDLADEHDRIGLGIRREQLQDVQEAAADDRIAPDPDTRRLADARVGHRLDRLIGEGAGA
jgi:hypothetical protein